MTTRPQPLFDMSKATPIQGPPLFDMSKAQPIDPIVQMAADPDFPKMPLDEQRKALTAHDPDFAGLGDDEITKFVTAHQAPKQTLAQMVRSKYPGAYDDLDDATLETNVLAKYPEYSDLPRSTKQTPESQAPNATAQAKQVIQGIPKFTSPGDELRGTLANAQESPKYNDYMRQSGQVAGTMAGGMATGGLLPFLKGAGTATNALRLGGRAALSGAGMGTGALVGGATPQEAKGAAETGLVGQPIGEGIGALFSKIAPSMAESALGVTDRMRGRGRTIGQSVLDKASGVRPATIAKSASSQLGSATSQMEDAVHEATVNGVVGSTQPAHDVLDNALQSLPRNARTIRDKISSLHDLLDLDGTGKVQYTPDELLEMKRGIGKEMQSWPPEWQKMSDVKQVQQRLYGALDGELDNLVPGNAERNQGISSLIPAKQQASRLSDAASTSQRIAHRMAAHTGALAGSGIGGALGYKEGGPKGAAIGAAAGLALPELLASPTAQMTAARTMNAAGKAAPVVLPWMKTLAASQQVRKKPSDADPDDPDSIR